MELLSLQLIFLLCTVLLSLIGFLWPLVWVKVALRRQGQTWVWQILNQRYLLFVRFSKVTFTHSRIEQYVSLFKYIWMRPHGCQGCQKNRKGTRIISLLCFCTNIHYSAQIVQTLKNLIKSRKSIKNECFMMGFSKFLQFGLDIIAKTHQVTDYLVLLFFLTPLELLGSFHSEDITVFAFVFNISEWWRPLQFFLVKSELTFIGFRLKNYMLLHLSHHF